MTIFQDLISIFKTFFRIQDAVRTLYKVTITFFLLLDIGQHEQCFLGFNPAHAVVTRKDNYLDDIVSILTAMSSMYGSNQTDWTKFQLFNSTKYGGGNLLFKDSSTELVGISKDKRTYKGYLGDEHVSDIKALETCDTSDSTKTTPYAVIVLFVALLVMLLL